MCDEELVDILERHAELGEALQTSAAAIEQQFIAASLDQRARAEAVHRRIDEASTQQ